MKGSGERRTSRGQELEVRLCGLSSLRERETGLYILRRRSSVAKPHLRTLSPRAEGGANCMLSARESNETTKVKKMLNYKCYRKENDHDNDTFTIIG